MGGGEGEGEGGERGVEREVEVEEEEGEGEIKQSVKITVIWSESCLHQFCFSSPYCSHTGDQ